LSDAKLRSLVVDTPVQTTNDSFNSNLEYIANPQESRHCNRATCFDLLPVTSGKSEGNHIFLAMAALLAEFLNSAAKDFEEFGLIYHAASFTVT
jgi:hypothetical protein